MVHNRETLIFVNFEILHLANFRNFEMKFIIETIPYSRSAQYRNLDIFQFSDFP